MLDPKDARFRDAWEDGIAPRWKDAPDDPRYGFGTHPTRFRARGMTFLGHAGLLDVYLGALGNINNPGIQFCRQAADGFLLGDRWVSCFHLDNLRRDGPGSDDSAYAANLFANLLRHHGLAVPGVPRRPISPNPMDETVAMLRAEYARSAGLSTKSSAPTASPRGTRVSGFVMYADAMPGKDAFVPASPSDAHRYNVSFAGRYILFLGQIGNLDVWRKQAAAVAGDVDLFAVAPDGSEEKWSHSTLGCVVPTAPTWVQPVVDWFTSKPKATVSQATPFEKALGHDEDCRCGRHEWSNGPVAREENRTCKWCGRSKATVKRAGAVPQIGDRVEDRSGHGNDLTTKPGNPLPCAGCGKPSTRPLGALRVCDGCGDLLLWSRAGGKAEILEKLAAEHAERMAAELRDPHMRHGLVEQALHLYAGRRGFSAAAPPSIAGKSDDEADAARQRQKDAENRLVDAILIERREDAEHRRNRSRVRTEAECRAVRERMIQENVPAWLDPRRK